MKIYDISLEISENMIVYPGNPKPKFKRISQIPKHSSNSSLFSFGSHTGTHVDSPLHIENKAPGAEKIKLENFYGKCQVLDLTDVDFGKGISEEDLKKFKIKKKIVLFKTKNSETKYYLNNKKLKKDFVYLKDDGAEYLLKKNVKTVGIDYLSIQKFHAGYCAAHCILIKNKVIVFEGLNLSQIEPGEYIFIGLPLKIKDSDGSPARAILIK